MEANWTIHEGARGVERGRRRNKIDFLNEILKTERVKPLLGFTWACSGVRS